MISIFNKNRKTEITHTFIRGMNADIKEPIEAPIETPIETPIYEIIDKSIRVIKYTMQSTCIIQVLNSSTDIVIVNKDLINYIISRLDIRLYTTDMGVFIDEHNHIVCRCLNGRLNVLMKSFRNNIYEREGDDIVYKPNMNKFYASLPIFGFDKATIITLLDLPDNLISLLMKEE